MKNASRLTLALFLSLSFLCSHARAQDDDDPPRLEVGAQFSSLSVNIPDLFGTETQVGFGGRVTYNFNEHFAAEAEGNFYPKESAHGFTTGGRVGQMQFGVKAGKRFGKFGVFAKARPGFISFSEVATQIGERIVTLEPGVTVRTGIFERRRKTHFTTDLGGVLEFYPSRKIVTRFDFGDTLIRYGAHTVAAPPPLLVNPPPGTVVNLIVERPAETRHNFQFTAGVAYRFGGGDSGGGGGDAPAAGSSSAADAPRFEAAVQFTSLTLNAPRDFIFFAGFDETRNEPGVGGRLTYNFNDSFAVEGVGNFFTTSSFSDLTTGGYPFQAQFGAKFGRRFDRFGLFGKVRPGFVGFSDVTELTGVRLEGTPPSQFVVPDFRQTRRLYFSTDVGGVLELYPSRRIVTRFDFGDTIIRYGERDAPGPTLAPLVVPLPAETRHNFQFSAGLGFRF